VGPNGRIFQEEAWVTTVLKPALFPVILVCMMAWAEFSRYSLNRKIRTLYEHGTFVMAIRYYRYKINLYLLGGCYIEVFINHKEAAIEKISLLDSTHTRMKFYSDQIKLPIEMAEQKKG
jgi:hypothetical protein